MSPCVSWRRLNSTESKYEIFMASPQTNIEGKKRLAGSTEYCSPAIVAIVMLDSLFCWI